MIYYVTGSAHKFETARDLLKKRGIEITQKILDIKEIQSESLEEIALDKARQAFEIVAEPLFINDSGWFIPALNGFPGPFMAYINKWLTAQGLIALMHGKTNREVTLKQVVVYIDQAGSKIFTHETKGTVVDKPSANTGRPSEMVASFSGNGLTVTDMRARGINTIGTEPELWEEMAKFLLSHP